MRMNIGKSGTGIGKSGTGIGKSGTGIGVGVRWVGLFVTAMMLATVQAVAGSNLLITEYERNVVISLHAGSDVVVGSVPMTGEYQVFALYRAMSFDDDHAVFQPLVKGSGSGSSGFVDPDDDHGLDVKGSGSGASGESGCASGPGLMVKGSGSGASGESNCGDGASLMVKGSGSGASGESACASGPGLMVKGSGSGASGEAASACQLPADAWGVVEVVVDQAGIHLMIHRAGAHGLTEYMVAFMGSDSGTPPGEARRPDFVAVPVN